MRRWFRHAPPAVLQEVASVGISAEEIEAVRFAISNLRVEAANLVRNTELADRKGRFEAMKASELMAATYTRHYERLERFLERVETTASKVTT